ncbi:hypothetical protein MIDIC_110047 [Alphaproteobacteria bacterium]
MGTTALIIVAHSAHLKMGLGIICAARKFNVNPKTIIKQRKHQEVEDLPVGPKKIKSAMLSEAEESVIVTLMVTS